MSIFKRLDHISIGVHDLDAARRLFVDVLGGRPLKDVGANEDEGFRWTTFNLGGKKVELVSPTAPGEGGVGRYLAKRGEGFHHLSISVGNLAEAIQYFESHGVRVLSPNTTNPDWKHCYLHPQDTHGALIQVFEETDRTLAGSGDAED
ncbi:MAG: VOC family protein [Pirellulales bacterium]